MKHLVLVGLPGSGKTTVGRAAAKQAQLPFLDFDEEIERRTGLAPSEFFRLRGEPAFRSEELALSRELVGGKRHTIVVAPGGGWIAQEAARKALRPQAVLVYLKVTPGVALARLGEGAQLRPLLVGADPVARLTHLLQIREPFYESADHVIDTEAVDFQALTKHVARLARQAQGASS
ncbi:MAG: shikimate kinase [Gemmatimonadaceae bacterium]